MKRRVGTSADQVRDEQRRALRALLLRPMLTSLPDTAPQLHLVRRHAEHLRGWLGKNVDWTLTVEPDMARLRKVPGSLDDGTRPAVDETSGLSFTRRRYVLLCLALAVLERSERQTALDRLAREVATLHAAEPSFEEAGLSWDMTTQDGRRDLVHAVRLLLRLGVLSRVQGDEVEFMHDKGDVLYNVNRSALAHMLSARRPPSMVDEPTLADRIQALVEEPAPESEDARNRRLRLTLTRRLLDDPVLYVEELNEQERAYLISQRAHLTRQIEEATGLVTETRQEGIAMVDEGGHLTDFGLPEEGTEGHLALLLAEFLGARHRKDAHAVVPRAEVVAHVAHLATEYGTYWRKEARAPGAEESLADETLRRLEALRLVRLTPEGVVPRAAIGRYALAPVGSGSGDTDDLFGDAPTPAGTTTAPRKSRRPRRA